MSRYAPITVDLSEILAHVVSQILSEWVDSELRSGSDPDEVFARLDSWRARLRDLIGVEIDV